MRLGGRRPGNPPDPEVAIKLADEAATYLPNDMRSALSKLSAKHRTRLLLNTVVGYTEYELADMLGVSQVAVNHSTRQAKSQLRQVLAPLYGYADALSKT